MTCAYYRMKLDKTLWALRVEAGCIVSAVGPLPESATSQPPMAHPPANPPVDVAGWTLAALAQASDAWELNRKTRIGPQGLKQLKEDENGFLMGIGLKA